MAQLFPLTHARTSDQFVRVVAGGTGVPKIFSPAKVAALFSKPVRPESAEAALGTHEFVFLYCGQFRYPHTQVGFLFATTLEDERAASSEASPFDSGALHKHVTLPNPSVPATTFLARHTLPVPQYRDLLAYRTHYLFTDPRDYVTQSSPPVRPDPIGLQARSPTTGTDPRLWTFEVRVRDELSVSLPHLIAVFYPAHLRSRPDIVNFLSAQGSGVRVEQVHADDDHAFAGLQSCCLDYLRSNGIIN